MDEPTIDATDSTRPTRPDEACSTRINEGGRAAVLWTGGVGVILLLLAAGVLVAVRWNEIGESVKVAGLVAVNGGVVVLGRRLRAHLPMTASVLVHLGALLVPVSVSAGTLLGGAAWDVTLLCASAAAVASWWWLNRIDRSVVLEAAITGGVVAVAGGVAATCGLPAMVTLGVVALAAAVFGDHVRALWWAHVAVYLPALVFVGLEASVSSASSTADLARTLGLLPATSLTVLLGGAVATALTVLLGGALGTAAIVWAGQATRRADWALAAVVAGVATAASSAPQLSVPSAWNHAVVPAIAVLTGVLALAVRRDPLWYRPVHGLARGVEAMLAVATPVIVMASVGDSAEGVGTAASIAVVAWFAADARRLHPELEGVGRVVLTGGASALGARATMGMAFSAGAAAMALTSTAVAPVVLVVLAGSVVAVRRAGVGLTAVGLTWAAVALATPDLGAWIVGLGGCAVLAGAAGRRTPGWSGSRAAIGTGLVAAAAAAPALLVFENANQLLPASGSASFLVVLTLVAVAAERGTRSPIGARVGLAARLLGLSPLLLVGTVDDPSVLTIGLVVLIISAVELVRSRDERMLLPLAALSPLFASSVLVRAEVGTALLGLTLVGLGAGVSTVSAVARRWTLSGVVAATMLCSIGLGLSSDDATVLGLSLLVAAFGGVTASKAGRSPDGLAFSLCGATAGAWTLLVDADVRAIEAYLAPAVVLALLDGLRRRPGCSSWSAYGPALALLAGAGLMERLAGGGAGHSLVVGVVGVAGVVTGAQRRLAGPLLIGSTALVLVGAVESFGYAASVPTWGWLGAAGSLLVGVAVTIERADMSPAESGRRLLAIIQGEFS